MAEDNRVEPPEQIRPPEPTTKAIPQTEILSGLMNKLALAVERVESKQDAGFVAVKADFTLLAGQFDVLERDVRGLQSWRVRTDDWRAQSEMRLSSNSIRAQQTSSIDLEHDAKIASLTTQLLEEKSNHEKLKADAATKADVAAVLAENKLQTAMMTAVLESPMVRKIGYAAGALLLQALALATAYLALRSHSP